jgi:hypothetical protein
MSHAAGNSGPAPGPGPGPARLAAAARARAAGSEARIMVPARLSRAERRLFEQLAAESDFDPRSRP